MIKRVGSWIHPADGVEGSHLNALRPELSGWTGQAWGLQLWKHPACLHPTHWVTHPKRTQGLRSRRGRAAAHCGLQGVWRPRGSPELFRPMAGPTSLALEGCRDVTCGQALPQTSRDMTQECVSTYLACHHLHLHHLHGRRSL